MSSKQKNILLNKRFIGIELLIVYTLLLFQPFPIPAMLVVFVLSLAVWIGYKAKSRDLGISKTYLTFRIVGIALIISAVYSLFDEVVLRPFFAQMSKIDLSSFDELEGDLPDTLLYIGINWLVIALIEELVYRVYLTNRIEQLINNRRIAHIVTIVVGSFLFGYAHIYQGVGGVIIETIAAIMLYGLYIYFNKNFWLVYLVHGLTNTIFLLLVYNGIRF